MTYGEREAGNLDLKSHDSDAGPGALPAKSTAYLGRWLTGKGASQQTVNSRYAIGAARSLPPFDDVPGVLGLVEGGVDDDAMGEVSVLVAGLHLFEPAAARPAYGSHQGPAGAQPHRAVSPADVGARRVVLGFISLGCPLSPLIGAFFLHALDAAAAKLHIFYVRFMDDILILAPTRWQLRGAVKVVNQALGALSLEKHRDKSFIGRIERGFDFLGYHFSPARLSVAKKIIDNFIEKASRLYEQRRRAGSSASPLEMYVR